MLYFHLLYDIKITLKSHFWCKSVIILSICMQRCYGRHACYNVSRTSVTTSCLSNLLHGVISLPDATSYDKIYIFYTSAHFQLRRHVINDAIFTPRRDVML